MRRLEDLDLDDLRSLTLGPDLTLSQAEALLREWRRRDLRAQVPVERLLERWLHLSPMRSPQSLAAMLRPFRPDADCGQLATSYYEAWTRKWDEGGAPGRRRSRPATWPWPTTEVSRGRGGFDATFAHEESALHRCGYIVGTARGMALAKRHCLLNHFFEEPLPSFVARDFGDKYGAPESEQRLRKMANVMAANCRNFKRINPVRYEVAIDSWEVDLEYLRTRFYDGWYPFEWPAPAVLLCA